MKELNPGLILILVSKMKNIYKQSLLLIITLRVNYWEDNNNAIVYNKNIGFQTGSCSESLFLWRLVGIFKQNEKYIQTIIIANYNIEG
jgi:hypothetical protein